MAKVNEAILTEVRNMLELGLTTEKIAEELGVSVSKVSTIKLEMVDEGKIPDPKKIKTERDKEVIAAYEEGHPIKHIVEKFEVSRPTIYSILSNHDIPPRSKRPKYKEARARQIEEALQMYIDGYKIKDIVEETGVHQPTIHEKVKERNIPMRQERGK